MSESFPELPEADAPALIAAIYGEIRALSGVPMVALIFRHLATMPGVLEEVWDGIGPLLRAGMLQETAWQIARREGGGLELPSVRGAARVAIGIDARGIQRLHNIFDAYNRANPVNLLCMLCLLERMSDPSQSEPLPSAARWTPPPPTAALPPMIAVDAMPLSARWLLNDFGFGDRSRLDPVVPSLFRHVADDAPLLALLHVLLAEHFADGTIERVMARVEQAMAVEAKRLARYLPPLERCAAQPGLSGVLTRFSGGVIPQMIVVGYALRRSFD